jgi:hypothetical protein
MLCIMPQTPLYAVRGINYCLKRKKGTGYLSFRSLTIYTLKSSLPPYYLCWAKTRLSTFPIADFGKLARNSICLGTL